MAELNLTLLLGRAEHFRILFSKTTAIIGLGITLTSCQSVKTISLDNASQPSNPSSTSTIPSIELAMPAPENLKTDLPIWASGYDWQLQRVLDASGTAIDVSSQPPIALEIQPSTLDFQQDCDIYRLDFLLGGPRFPYHTSVINKKQPECVGNRGMDNKADLDNADNTDSREDNSLKALLPNYPYFNFNLQLLPIPPSFSNPSIANTDRHAARQLALAIEHGNTFIFQGQPKVLAEPSGLPITKAILEEYQWRLVSAASNHYDEDGKLVSREPIGDFYHPDFPVTLRFKGYPDSRHWQEASFNSNCNEVGGPYALLEDYTLLVGLTPQTVMGCGLNGNRINEHLAKLVNYSESKLNLSLQLSTTKPTDFPRYNLLQTMSTGETLVWQNEPLPERKSPVLKSEESPSAAEIDYLETTQPTTNIELPNE
ncbi:hypothetical protein [Psychrobacter pygoscelis]|uniref:hypothetical protein n=1 Tax=Psychrobacter pygoscelis TaxID=2488563 RepID=UPI00103AF8D3|nr:hypothetical protein [Psychrobacter pygoscelis]